MRVSRDTRMPRVLMRALHFFPLQNTSPRINASGALCIPFIRSIPSSLSRAQRALRSHRILDASCNLIINATLCSSLFSLTHHLWLHLSFSPSVSLSNHFSFSPLHSLCNSLQAREWYRERSQRKRTMAGIRRRPRDEGEELL